MDGWTFGRTNGTRQRTGIRQLLTPLQCVSTCQIYVSMVKDASASMSLSKRLVDPIPKNLSSLLLSSCPLAVSAAPVACLSPPPQLNFESEKEMFKLEMRQSIKQRRTKRRRRRRRFRPMCPKKGRILRRRNRKEVADLVFNLWVFGGGLEGNCSIPYLRGESRAAEEGGKKEGPN